ncbi:Protein disulfide-isomerase [Pseudocercospora fuligena]|uniref:Protein disulfide-isomerase n=1 Tax=Pseudocercospora fuligena TaxID=685502 RepID=A0A8H6VGP3_9PEZI|nr:Protein disulfide-isomerase [Pseudocercospora fuligena]
MISSMILRLAVAVVLIGFASAKSAVLDATGQDLTSLVKRHSVTLVNYGPRWCGHCRLLAPKYEDAATFLAGLDLSMALAYVDCNEALEKCSDINAYPTLRLYYSWLDVDVYDNYTGPRTSDDIISFMTNGTYPKERISTSTTSIMPLPTSTKSSNQLPGPTAANAVVISDDRTKALVKLEIPGVSISSTGSTDRSTLSSSALLLFSVSKDGKHLLLNESPLALLIPNPSRPMRLISTHVEKSWNMSWIDTSDSRSPSDFDVWKSLGHSIALDYDLWARNRDDPSIVYGNYHPDVYFNLIGARLTYVDSKKTILLDSLEQKALRIELEQYNASRSSHDPNRAFRITSVTFKDRPSDYRAPRPDDRPCSKYSWRCADFGDPPWYQYVWHMNFDDYGRIGCMRRRLVILFDKLPFHIPTPRPSWLILFVPLTVVMLLKLSAKCRQRYWSRARRDSDNEWYGGSSNNWPKSSQNRNSANSFADRPTTRSVLGPGPEFKKP